MTLLFVMNLGFAWGEQGGAGAANTSLLPLLGVG